MFFQTPVYLHKFHQKCNKQSNIHVGNIEGNRDSQFRSGHPLAFARLSACFILIFQVVITEFNVFIASGN